MRIAVNIPHRAPGSIIASSPNQKAASERKRLRELSWVNASYAGMTQIRYSGFGLKR